MLDRVIDDADVTIITRRDAEDVVVMSLDTWNSWKETEYLLASPANARHLREAIAELNAGQRLYRELIEPDEVMRVQDRARFLASRPQRRKLLYGHVGRNMAKRLAFHVAAWENYLHRQTQDRKTLERINQLIRECLRDPFRGIGKPEPLKGELADWWSQRIDDTHRLVYRVVANDLEIITCHYHYGAR